MTDLKIGDIVFYKDYFCEVIDIEYYNLYNSPYKMFHIARKFRSNGSKIKSKWRAKVISAYLQEADVLFKMKIKEYEKLLQTFVKIKNE